MKSLAISLFLLCGLSGVSEGKEEERNCRVVYPDRPRDAPERVQLYDGSSYREVPLSGMNFSEVVKLPAGDLVLGMSHDTGDFPPDAPTVKIPAAISDFYLIVLSDPENKVLPIRMLPVEVGDDQPEPGQTLWINLTEHAIKGALGEESLTVPAGAKVMGEAPLAANGYFKAEFSFQAAGKGEFLPLMNKSWWFDASSANLGFIIDTGGRLPRIFTYRDFRVPAE